MTILAWPTDILPAVFMRDGFQYQRQPAVIRTDMESPAGRARLTDRNPLAKIPVACIMDSSQLDFFDSWLENDAAYGGAWFNIDLAHSRRAYPLALCGRKMESFFYARIACLDGYQWRRPRADPRVWLKWNASDRRLARRYFTRIVF
jgi:hypothetical protein